MSGASRPSRSRQSPSNNTNTTFTPRSAPSLNDEVTTEVGSQFVEQPFSNANRPPRPPSSSSFASTIRQHQQPCGRATSSVNRNAGLQSLEHPASGSPHAGPTWAQVAREHVRLGSQLHREYHEDEQRQLGHTQGQPELLAPYNTAPQHLGPDQAAMHINPVAIDAAYVPGSRYNNLAHMTYQGPVTPSPHVPDIVPSRRPTLYPALQHMPPPYQQGHPAQNFHRTAGQTQQTSQQPNPAMPPPVNTNPPQHLIASPPMPGRQTYAQALQSPPRPPAPMLRCSTRGRSGTGNASRTPSSRPQPSAPSRTGRLGTLNGRGGSRRGSLCSPTSLNQWASAAFDPSLNITPTTNSFASPFPASSNQVPTTPTPSITSAGTRRTRQQMTEGDDPYVCDVCGSRFPLQCHLSQHRRVHGIPRHHCDFQGCDYRVFFPAHLQRHIESVHLRIRPYPCPVPDCRYHTERFPRRDQRKRHVKSQHPGVPVPRND